MEERRDIRTLGIKKHQELLEEENLSKRAAYSVKSTREYSLPPNFLNYQTNFQYDRTMIINSKSFRRLRNKAQVFISPTNDHHRTRMTHTYEVADIAKIISKALRLNDDLAESIALAHDLGHTPFGHAGEKALRDVYDKNFSHELQGRRVVELLEKIDYLDHRGLNLTFEVRDGIQNHDFESYAKTLEGQVVKFADKIAYISHDIEDAFSAKLLSYKTFPNEYLQLFGKTVEERKNTLITSVIEASYEKDIIMMHKEHLSTFKELRKYMFSNVYLSDALKSKEEAAMNKVKKLFEYYSNNPKKIPRDYSFGDERRRACDYISAMTDSYAQEKYNEIFKEKNTSLKDF